jgi:hypothetical protein
MTATMHISSSLLLLALPFTLLPSLSLKKPQRNAATFLLFIAVLSLLISIVRLAVLLSLSLLTPLQQTTHDITQISITNTLVYISSLETLSLCLTYTLLSMGVLLNSKRFRTFFTTTFTFSLFESARDARQEKTWSQDFPIYPIRRQVKGGIVMDSVELGVRNWEKLGGSEERLQTIESGKELECV